MKKVILAIGAFAVILSCTGCIMLPANNRRQVPRQISTHAPTQIPTQIPTQAPTQVPAPTDSGALGDYEITIKDYKLSKDYSGKPAILISYDFKNNADKETSFMMAVSTELYQDGVELSSAIITDKNYDSQAQMKNIKPGITLEVQKAYLLASYTSPVEVEVSELLSFTKDEKLVKTFHLSE